MRARFKAPYNIPQTYNLPWSADYITVINPTKYTVYIRVGAQDIPPDTNSADLIVFPASFATYPVDGNLFGLVLKEPALLGTQSSMPSTAFVHFSSVEQPPISNAIQLPQNPSKNIFGTYQYFTVAASSDIQIAIARTDYLYRRVFNSSTLDVLLSKQVSPGINSIVLSSKSYFEDKFGVEDELWIRNNNTSSVSIDLYTVRYF